MKKPEQLKIDFTQKSPLIFWVWLKNKNHEPYIFRQKIPMTITPKQVEQTAVDFVESKLRFCKLCGGAVCHVIEENTGRKFCPTLIADICIKHNCWPADADFIGHNVSMSTLLSLRHMCHAGFTALIVMNCCPSTCPHHLKFWATCRQTGHGITETANHGLHKAARRKNKDTPCQVQLTRPTLLRFQALTARARPRPCSTMPQKPKRPGQGMWVCCRKRPGTVHIRCWVSIANGRQRWPKCGFFLPRSTVS